MQFRMSPTGGRPSWVRSLPGRAPVVGDRDDRGEVARVLLEPAQQRRQPGPAAERHDAWAAGEEPLLVDDLDERPVLVVGPERVGQDPDHLPRGEREDGHADRREDERPESVRQGLEGDGRDDRLDRLAELDVAIDLAEHEREAERQAELPEEDHDEPALDSDPGGEPTADLVDARPAARSIAHGIRSARARDGTRRRSRSPARGATRRAPRRWRSTDGSRRCSRCRSSAGSCLR